MKIPKYIIKMINDRQKAQSKSNKLQIEIEKWFDEHNIEVEWKNAHVGLYVEEKATMSMYLGALKHIEDN